MNTKNEFLEDIKVFTEFGKLNPSKYWPILEHDYDILIGLGFKYVRYMERSDGREAWLSFVIYLTDKTWHGPSLNIMILSHLHDPQRPIVYYGYLNNAEGHISFSEDTLEEVLNKIIEAANAN